jgi:cyclic pyranopterin phosphate synthase
MSVVDTFGRPLRNLRLSVTDRCNLRCAYCMPEQDYVWLPREDLLQFEEIGQLADVFLSAGVNRLRLTGGEPLLRRNLASLVQLLSRKQGLVDLAMTTNGILLAEQVGALRAAGLHRVTVSLDTLRADRFVALTRFDELNRVREGIDAAARTFGGLKIDTVVIRGVNDDELVDLLEYATGVHAEIRFIEYMDVGGATQWSPERVVARGEILSHLSAQYGTIEPIVDEASTAPADRFALPDGRTFGIISSTTSPFCRSCDRSRLTADGMWYQCLYATRGTDLRAPLRAGASASDLRALIENTWSRRDDRGAETRLALGNRRAFVSLQTLKKNPHLEMHTRGG